MKNFCSCISEDGSEIQRNLLQLLNIVPGLANKETLFPNTGTQSFIRNSENRKAPKTEHFLPGRRLHTKSRVWRQT